MFLVLDITQESNGKRKQLKHVFVIQVSDCVCMQSGTFSARVSETDCPRALKDTAGVRFPRPPFSLPSSPSLSSPSDLHPRLPDAKLQVVTYNFLRMRHQRHVFFDQRTVGCQPLPLHINTAQKILWIINMEEELMYGLSWRCVSITSFFLYSFVVYISLLWLFIKAGR